MTIVAPARLRRRDRVERHRRRIGARLRAHQVDAGALGPDGQLLDGRRAKRVGRADQHRSARRPVAGCASLPTVVVLPVPLTPTTRITCGLRRDLGRRPARRVRMPQHDARDALARATRRDRPAPPRRCARSPAARRRRRSARLRAPRCVSTVTRAPAAAARRRGRRRAAPRRPAARGSAARSSRDRLRMRSKTEAMISSAVVLAALRPQHQIADGLARASCGRRAPRPSGSRSAARRRARRPAPARPSSCARLRPPCACRRGSSSSDRPAPELDADVAVAAERARARQDEIAQAAQAGQRFAPAAHRARQPRDLREAARDERRHARCARGPCDSTTPAAIAMMFFSAAPISTPTTSSDP